MDDKQIVESASLETTKTRIQNQIKEKKKKSRGILRKLEDVFQSFDEIEEESDAKLPPIPSESVTQDFLLRNALLLVDNGEYGLARHILGEILKRNSFHLDAIRWMGWCFKQEGEFESAIKCYEQLKLKRKTEEDLFELGELYYDMKRNEDALQTWLEALTYCGSEGAKLFDLHKNLGNAYMRLGDLDASEENYNKAFTLRPHSDALQVNLGSLWFYKRDLKKAFECFKAAVDINPYNDRAWCGVALIAREKKDYQWAKEMVLRSLDLNPENLVALQLLVQWALEDKDHKEAIERVMLYTFQNQDDISMMYSIAGLLFDAGHFLEAELELERILILSPQHEAALQLKNIIHAKRD